MVNVSSLSRDWIDAQMKANGGAQLCKGEMNCMWNAMAVESSKDLLIYKNRVTFLSTNVLHSCVESVTYMAFASFQFCISGLFWSFK